jgi:uncharacterized protein YbaA (DUF1428 family)
MVKSKANYVDGYVLVVPKKNIKAYRKMAFMGGKAWKKYGALDYKETVGDDLKTKWGVSFAKIMKVKPSETVVFSFVTFKSKKHRNTVNAKVMKQMMADQEKSGIKCEMPFDMKKMAYGGFRILVDA